MSLDVPVEALPDIHWKESLEAEEFIQKYLIEGHRNDTPTLVMGRVEFRNQVIENELYLGNFYFDDEIDFTYTVFKSPVLFEKCVLGETLKAAHTVFKGALLFRDVFCRLEISENRFWAMLFSGARFHGDCAFTNVHTKIYDPSEHITKNTGQLNLSKAVIEGRLQIQDCIFGCKHNGSEIHDKAIALDLSESEIKGRTLISSSRLINIGLHGILNGLATRFLGGLFFKYKSTPGSVIQCDGIYLRNAHIDVALEIQCAQIYGDLILEKATCESILIDHVDFIDKDIKSSKNINLKEVKASSIRLRNLTWEGTAEQPDQQDVSLNDTSISAGLSILALKNAFNLNLEHLKASKLTLIDCEIDQETDLSHAQVRGEVRLDNTTIHGPLKMEGGKFGLLQMQSLPDPSNKTCRRNTLALLDVENCEIHSDVNLSGIHVGLHLHPNENSADIEDAYNAVALISEKKEYYKSGIAIQNCRIGGDLKFWAESQVTDNKRHYTAWQNDQNRTIVKGNIEILRTQIAGDLSLTRINALPLEEDLEEDRDAAIQSQKIGGIDLSHSAIAGNIAFLSPERVKADPTVPKRLDDLAEDWLTRQDICNAGRLICDTASTRATFLVMKHVKATNVDLSGIVIEANSIDPINRNGHIDVSGAHITGKLSSYANANIEEEGELVLHQRAACFPGALRLKGCHIESLEISNASLDETDTSPDIKNLDLSDSTIEDISVFEAREEKHKKKKEFLLPEPVNMTHAKIQHIGFNQDETSDDKEYAALLIRFLKNNNGAHFDRKLYRHFYRNLRAEGRTKAATEVFIAEHDLVAEVTKPKEWWKRALTYPHYLFWQKFLQYGVGIHRIAYIILALALFSGFTMAPDARNFELSSEARLIIASQILNKQLGDTTDTSKGIAYQERTNAIGPDPNNWRNSDAFWITLRYHIPLIGLMVRADFTPTDDGSLWVGNQEWAWLTPEDWFSFMAILNWLMFPLLLTFLVRKVMRDGEL